MRVFRFVARRSFSDPGSLVNCKQDVIRERPIWVHWQETAGTEWEDIVNPQGADGPWKRGGRPLRPRG